jgi:lipoprotein NlpD
MGKLTSETPLVAVYSCRLYRLKWIGLTLIGLLILSCSGFPLRDTRPRGVYHHVKGGETLYAIARAYRVDLQELAEINNISHAERIEAGSVIFIPDANQIVDDIMIAVRPTETVPEIPAKEKPAKNETAVFGTEISKDGPEAERKRHPQPSAEAAVKAPPVLPRPTERVFPRPTESVLPHGTERDLPRPAERDLSPGKGSERSESAKTADPPAGPKEQGEKPEQIRFDKIRFIWPVKGTVVSTFGIQPNRMYFNGIRIAAGEGTSVQAAADGVVIFSAPLKDYGETIIIRHEDHYATVYASLGIRTIRGEAKVKKGDRIAFIGKALDRKQAASLHFEIRHNNKARNPLFFLP